MAQYKTLRNRIKTIQTTKKITQAMKLTAVASLEKTKNKLQALKYYQGPIKQTFSTLLNPLPNFLKPYFKPQVIKKELVICLAADKGLCGGYNHTLYKHIHQYHQQKTRAGIELHYLPLGKKVHHYIQKANKHTIGKSQNITNITFTEVDNWSQKLQNLYKTKYYHKITILYKTNMQSNTSTIKPWLPLPHLPTIIGETPYTIYEPQKATLTRYLLAQSLTCDLYQAILHAQRTEYKCRMVAMNKATESAEELLKEQKLKYNRLRQATITQGIMEVAGSLIT